MKKNMLILICVIVFLACAAAVLYPLISNTIAEQNLSEIRVEYDAAIARTDTERLDEIRAQADRYNATLSGKSGNEEDLQLLAQYATLLSLTENGMMGRIIIPAIDVDQPIYHGGDESFLQLGAGHVSGTSLPVGGNSTHTVISGHTGMAGQKMFTDLEQLQVGDLFQLDVLGDTLTYEVDQINVVLPSQIEHLQIVPGEDLATLLTCTPYGINSHRLLVRGHRIETPEAGDEQDLHTVIDRKESKWAMEYRHGLLVGTIAAVCVAALMIGVVWYRRKRK